MPARPEDDAPTQQGTPPSTDDRVRESAEGATGPARRATRRVLKRTTKTVERSTETVEEDFTPPPYQGPPSDHPTPVG